MHFQTQYRLVGVHITSPTSYCLLVSGKAAVVDQHQARTEYFTQLPILNSKIKQLLNHIDISNISLFTDYYVVVVYSVYNILHTCFNGQLWVLLNLDFRLSTETLHFRSYLHFRTDGV